MPVKGSPGHVVILGAGPAGLAVGHELSVAPDPVTARPGFIAESKRTPLVRQLPGQFGQGIRRVRNIPDKSPRAAHSPFGNGNRNALLVNVQTHERDILFPDPFPMHEARHRTIRRNPRHLHTVRRVTLALIGHGV